MSRNPYLALGVLAIAGAEWGGAGCGAPPPPPKPVIAEMPPCDESPAPKRHYTGLLSHIHCEKDLYLTMADIAGDLAVECDYCHTSDKSTDTKKFSFTAMTNSKQIALFMHHVFVDGLKAKDGKEMSCASCHVDKSGKPAAKFLGEPRDVRYANEWMNLVMVNQFIHLDGSKLRCKDCHGGNFGTPDFHPQVIMKAHQINLPGVAPFEAFPDNPPEGLIPAPVNPNPKPVGSPPLGTTAAPKD